MRRTGVVFIMMFITASTITAHAAEPYLDAFRKAQPVISATVEAYGGIERLQAIESLSFDIEGENYLRYQSEKLGPPFETQSNKQKVLVDLSAGRSLIDAENGPNRNIFIGVKDTSYQLNPVDSTYAEGPAVALDEHYIHRIVPALLARKLYERATQVLWIGEGEIESKPTDALALTWANGNQYVIHVDRASKLITAYDILFADPVIGDGVFQAVFGDYVTVDGIAFSQTRAQAIEGEKTYTLRSSNTQINPDLAEAFAVPENYTLQEAPAGGGANPEFEELGKGVYLAGVNYRTLFVDLGEEIVAVDAGGSFAESRRSIADLRERVGDKPIRSIVLTHHHSDHIQSVGQYVLEGAKVVTTKSTEPLVRRVAKVQYSAANVTNLDGVEPQFERVRDKKTFAGDTNDVQIYRVPNGHAREYLVAYVPQLGLLYSADVFGFPMNGSVPATSDDLREFWKNLGKRKLEIKTVANAHGRVATYAELEARLQE